MNFALILCIALVAPTLSKTWAKEKEYLCNDSIRLKTKITQTENPFEDKDWSRIEFDANVMVFLDLKNKNTREFNSILLFQCPLCSPVKLKSGNDTLRFRLSEIFTERNQAIGRFYVVFHGLRENNDKEEEKPSCFRSRVEGFELMPQ